MDDSHISFALGLTLGCAALAAGLPLPAASQSLPQSPRVVLKCEVAGQTVYTDKPCPDAQRSELLRVRASAPASDASPEPYSDTISDSRPPASELRAAVAVSDSRPPANEPRAPVAERLPKLAGTPQAECPHLGQRIALVEAEEKTASSRTMPMIQERLTVQRLRYAELGCSPYWVSSSQARMSAHAVRARVWASGSANRTGS